MPGFQFEDNLQGLPGLRASRHERRVKTAALDTQTLPRNRRRSRRHVEMEQVRPPSQQLAVVFVDEMSSAPEKQRDRPAGQRLHRAKAALPGWLCPSNSP